MLPVTSSRGVIQFSSKSSLFNLYTKTQWFLHIFTFFPYRRFHHLHFYSCASSDRNYQWILTCLFVSCLFVHEFPMFFVDLGMCLCSTRRAGSPFFFLWSNAFIFFLRVKDPLSGCRKLFGQNHLSAV